MAGGCTDKGPEYRRLVSIPPSKPYYPNLVLAYLKNPTNPDSTADSSTISSVGPVHTSTSTPGISGGDPSLAPAPLLSQASLGVQPPSQVNALPSGFMEPNYEVFDPLNWLLDGLVDLPYSYSTMNGVETSGIA